MKTLVIHPDDRSTDFLRPVYHNLPCTTVITGDTTAEELIDAIRAHDQIIMLGHGTPLGLFNISNIGQNLLCIESQHTDILRDKKCIYIWCNADQFIHAHRLPGLYTGMFISEVDEANYCGISTEQRHVDDSNNLFAELLGKYLVKYTNNYGAVYRAVEEEYGKLAEVNAVAKYNHERWYLGNQCT